MSSSRPPRVPWTPAHFEALVDGPFDTSTGTARVRTNATFGFLKAMGNRQGPHALACDLVGSALADWFGLNVPEFAILRLAEVDCYPLPRGARTQPGPAFISKAIAGRTWGRSLGELERLVNPADITRLVVFDNWVRNCDRYPPDLGARRPNLANVFLADTDQPDRSRLYAIDHTHCFDSTPELSARLADIGRVKDDRVFGLFPEFEPFIDPAELALCREKLRTVTVALAQGIIASVPPEWEVVDAARAALVELIVRRAGYVADKMDRDWGLTWWLPPAE